MRLLLSITLDTSDIYHKDVHLIPILYYIFRSCYFSYFNKLPSLPIITILSKNDLFCRWFLIHEKPAQLTRFFSAEKIAYGRVINALAYVWNSTYIIILWSRKCSELSRAENVLAVRDSHLLKPSCLRQIVVEISTPPHLVVQHTFAYFHSPGRRSTGIQQIRSLLSHL